MGCWCDPVESFKMRVCTNGQRTRQARYRLYWNMATFGAVVAALVKDLLTPRISAMVGQPDFSAIVFTVNGSKFLIGDFINAVLPFVLVAAAIYFFVVIPMNVIVQPRRRCEAPPQSHHDKMLGVSERGTYCGTAVRLLYAAPAYIGRRAGGALA